MKTIRVTEATYHAIAAAATFPFQSTGERQADGTWLVPIEDETFERLDAHRLPSESDEDVVLRMLRAYLGRKPN
ncbi:MAG: hypothetical protein KDK07_20715 [Bauldia sp.]|nr:hypothetical protein [Bauldia sp.]